MHSLKISNNNEFFLAVFLIVCIQIIISFQGFDVCDDGFALTFYQQIFKNPTSVEYNFVYWLSGIVGGLWYSIYEEGGVLWFRLLTIICTTITFVVSFNILKQYISKRHALIGLAMVVFVNDFGFLTFYHNHLTALLAVSGIYFLHKGLTKNSNLAIVLAGFILGINVFSRLPNIALFIFILAIPYMSYLRKEPLSKSIRPMLNFVMGVAIGFILVFLTLYGLGQLELMKNAMAGLIDLGKTDGSTHNIMFMFKTYLYNYKKLITLFCKLLIICGFVLSMNVYFKDNRFIKTIISLIGVLLLILLFRKGNIHIIYAIAYIGVFGVLFTKQKNSSIKIVTLLGLLMLAFLPLGSGLGIYGSGYMCIWLAMPLFLHFLSQINNMKFNLKTEHGKASVLIPKESVKHLSIILVFSFFIAKGYSISQEAYFDKGSRFAKTYNINNKYTKGIYTTKERADIINELLVNLKTYVSPNDYLLAYDKIPMVHFLTETKPYMYNPWPMIYDSYSFKRNLDRAEKETKVLPIIVQQKFETTGNFSEPVLDYMSETKEDNYTYDKKRTIAMNAFIKMNNYKIVWSNPYFNIYQSKKMD